VLDTGCVEDRADGTAGDDTGTGSGRRQQDDACGFLALDRVRDGLLDAWHAEEDLLRFLGTLGAGGRNFRRLAVSHADHARAVAVVARDEGGDVEPTPARDDLRLAVGGHDVCDELVLVVTLAAAAASTAFAASAALAALSPLAAATGGAVTAVVVAGLSSRLLFLVLFSAHRANPPSRAPSAIACTRPW